MHARNAGPRWYGRAGWRAGGRTTQRPYCAFCILHAARSLARSPHVRVGLTAIETCVARWSPLARASTLRGGWAGRVGEEVTPALMGYVLVLLWPVSCQFPAGWVGVGEDVGEAWWKSGEGDFLRRVVPFVFYRRLLVSMMWWVWIVGWRLRVSG